MDDKKNLDRPSGHVSEAFESIGHDLVLSKLHRIGEATLRATCLKASFNNGAKLIVSLNCTR